MLDKGLPEAMLASVLDIGGAYIDIIKFGWGTAYVTPQHVAAAKVARCLAAGVHVSPGGTLFELAVSQDRVAQFAAWAGRSASTRSRSPTAPWTSARPGGAS